MSQFTTTRKHLSKVEIPPYPEGTPGYENKSGHYWPNLNESSAAMLGQIQRWVEDEGIDMSDLTLFCIDARLTMLRYLRANNFDFKKTTAHMLRNIAYRQEKNVRELIQKRPEDILGFPIEELTTMYPHWHSAYDKTGRPVLYKHYGKFDATKLKKMCGGNFDCVTLYHIWEQEMTQKLCYQQTLATGKLIETSTGVIDVKDMTFFQVTRDFLAIVQMLAEVDQQLYPETLGRMFIINVPSAFPMAWRLVKPWLDPVTAAKIFIHSSPKEYEAAMSEYVGVNN